MTDNEFKKALYYESLWLNKNATLENLYQTNNLLFDVVELTQFMYKKRDKANFITDKDEGFPGALKNTYIRAFYYNGDISIANNKKKVAIVGTREISNTGIEVATAITKDLIKKDYTIISGLAKGVDSTAMYTTVKENSRNLIGVIGTAIDEFYPKENKNLQQHIATNCLLISHIPFYKNSFQPFKTKRLYFPQRNAIMANLSDFTIIVEANDKSGTLTHAKHCLKAKKQIYIMDFNEGKWVDDLVSKGAKIISNVDDIEINDDFALSF